MFRKISMMRWVTQIALGLSLLLLAHADLSAQSQEAAAQNSDAAPSPQTGLDTTTQMSENPPLSGLDEPKFEPGFGARSYLAPKVEVSESVDSNSSARLSSTGDVSEITRALGSVELQKLWKTHPLDVDYIGGIDWYNRVNGGVYQLQSLAAVQRFLWRTGQFAVRDSFSYLPEGGFGFGSFGGAGDVFGGQAFSGGTALGNGANAGTAAGIFTNGQFGSIGIQPRVTNMGIADLTQYLSPRTAVVLTGAYGLTDFLGNNSVCAGVANCFFNSQETIVQAAYNYQLSRRNQIAATYAFEEFHFPLAGTGSLNVNLWQLLYGRRISGKLDFLAGGGPEWVHRSQSEEALLGILPIGLPCTQPGGLLTCVVIKNSFLTGSARVSLKYRVSARTNLSLMYLRYINSGSGFFGGANTDVVRFTMHHNLSRHWDVIADTGYSRNSRLLVASANIAGGNANYHYWYTGGGVHRQLGRYFGAFVSYQYDAFGFGSNGCSGAQCGLSYGRNIGLVGLHWTPHPIRLD